MRQTIRLHAHGKINLGLDVLRKREDGYHEVKMIMQTVALHDSLRITRSEIPGIRLTVDKRSLPAGEENLVVRAAKLMQKTYGIPGGMDIILKKRIPVAAGMAGGSTDAAAALKGINMLYELGLPDAELERLGVKLGADVPYCIKGGTALSEGIGEVLTGLSPMPACHILLVKPPIGVSTAFVYGNLRAAELKEHPDIDGMVRAIEEGTLSGITGRLGNVLETVTIPAFPVIEIIKEEMRRNGAEAALMSGSGPTVFGIFREKKSIERAAAALKRAGIAGRILMTTPYNGKEK